MIRYYTVPIGVDLRESAVNRLADRAYGTRAPTLRAISLGLSKICLRSGTPKAVIERLTGMSCHGVSKQRPSQANMLIIAIGNDCFLVRSVSTACDTIVAHPPWAPSASALTNRSTFDSPAK